jgi:hypothetical protein
VLRSAGAACGSSSTAFLTYLARNSQACPVRYSLVASHIEDQAAAYVIGWAEIVDAMPKRAVNRDLGAKPGRASLTAPARGVSYIL